jgi:hypothetical protein
MKLKSTLLTLILGSATCLASVPVLAIGYHNNSPQAVLHIADNSGIFSRFKSSHDANRKDEDNNQRRKQGQRDKRRQEPAKPVPARPGTRFAPSPRKERRDERHNKRRIEPGVIRREERRDIRHKDQRGIIHNVIRHHRVNPIRTVRRPHLHITYPEHIRRQYHYARGPWYYSHYITPLPWYFYPLGFEINVLPHSYARIMIGGLPYFYYSGVFYRSYGSGYIVVSAPIGAFVTSLPDGFIAFSIGPGTFYYVNDTYYTWDDAKGGYVVVEKPAGADEAIKQVTSDRLIVYPPEGLTEEQQAKDRYECHRWAVEESGIDPTIEEDEFSAKDRDDYRRALAACLEGRGYTVK